MARKKTMPKVLFVKLEYDRNDPDAEYFIAQKDRDTIIEPGGTELVGEYRLVKAARMRCDTTLREV